METEFKQKFNELSKESKIRILKLIKNLYSCSSQYEDGLYIKRNQFTIQCWWGEPTKLKSILLCVNDDKNAITSEYDTVQKELKIYQHKKFFRLLANVNSAPITK